MAMPSPDPALVRPASEYTPVRDLRTISRLCGALWGGWLTLFPLVDLFLRDPRGGLDSYNFEIIRDASPLLQAALFGLLLLGALPALVSVWQLKLDFRLSGNAGPILLGLALALVASGLMSTNGGIALQVLAAFFGISLSLAFASFVVDEEAFVGGFLRTLAIGHAVVLVMMIVDGNFSYGRLMGRAGPNYWGMVASTAVFASFAISSRLLRYAIVAIAVAVFILCQTRGSMGATAVGLAVVGAVWVLQKPQQRSLFMLGAILALGAIVIFSWQRLEVLLLLDDGSRGLESASGRASAWGEGLALFESSPLFGVGYRQSEELLSTASSTHNAYLTMLAETGLFGLVFYLLYLWGAAWRALLSMFRGFSLQKAGIAGFLVAYAFMGLLERRAINVGNAYSLTMLLLATWSFRPRSTSLHKAMDA